jgi:hypothetical protein
VEAKGEDIVWGVVEGQRVVFSSVCGKGKQIGHNIFVSADVLCCEAVGRLGDEGGEVAGNGLDNGEAEGAGVDFS